MTDNNNQDTKRIVVDVSPALHKALKQVAIENDLTLKEVVIGAITDDNGAVTGGVKKATVERAGGKKLRKIVAYFPDDVAKRLLVHCASEDIGISAYVVAAVQSFMDDNEVEQ